MSESRSGMSRKDRSSWRRSLGIIGLAIAAVIAAGVAGFAAAPKTATALSLRAVLAALGVWDAQFTVEEARWRKLVLGQVSLDDTLAARRLQTDFGRLGPFGGLRALDAEALKVSGVLDENGLSFGALDPLLFAGGGGGALPGFSIALSDVALALGTPYGQVTAQSPTIAIDPDNGGEARLALTIVPRADALMRVVPHEGTLSLNLSAAGALTLELSLQAAEMADSAAAAVPATESDRTRPLRLHSAKLVLEDFTAAGGQWQGRVALDANLDGPLRESVLFDNGALAMRGRVEGGHGRLAVFADDCADAHNIHLAMISFSMTSPAISFCPQADDHALLVQESGSLSLDARVPSAKITLESPDGGDVVVGMAPAFTIALAPDGAGWRASLKALGGTLTAPSVGLALSALDLSGDMTGEGDMIKKGALKLAHGEVADIERAPRFARLDLEGAVDVESRRARFGMEARVAGAGTIAHLDGEHDLDTAEGHAALQLEKLTFAPDALQPDRLLPLLRGMVTKAAGTVDGNASFAWDDAGFRSEANLNLVNLGFRAGFADIEGVNGAVKLASLFPLETPAPQEIRVRMMDVGVPLTDGVLRFEFARTVGLRVRKASFPFLSGTVSLLPFDLGGGAETRIVLAVDHVDLKALLELVDIKGLTGTGRLTGRVPVVFARGRQFVENGHAEAEAPGGVIAYKNPEAAAGAPGAQTEFLFKALDDFRYSALSVDLTGPLDGELSLKVHLKGNNPALYSGHPIELNVSTEGPFVSMLRKGLYAYREAGRQ